jgi:hypothetical protein
MDYLEEEKDTFDEQFSSVHLSDSNARKKKFTAT